MTIEIKRNTLWKQYGNIWHCRKTTISQFFSSSLWLWWDLEAWLGMAWQALALKVALATLMECMWHTRCLGDWTGVKCDEKPLRNHMVQFNTIYASWGLPASIGNLWVLVVILGVVLTHIYIYVFFIQRRPPFGLPEILLIAPNSRSKMLRHVGSFAAFQTKQTGHGHFSAFLKLRSSRSASAFYIFLLIKTTMICEYIYDSYYSPDSYAFFWPYCWTSSCKKTSKHSITPVVKKHLAKVWECSGASGICNMLQDAGAWRRWTL